MSITPGTEGEEVIPTVVSESTINLGDHTLRVYHLSNGQRVIDAEDVGRFFGAVSELSEEACPICVEPFEADDLCATDIDLGTCHAECLADSPVVDLRTGEPFDGPIHTFKYSELDE